MLLSQDGHLNLICSLIHHIHDLDLLVLIDAKSNALDQSRSVRVRHSTRSLLEVDCHANLLSIAGDISTHIVVAPQL